MANPLKAGPNVSSTFAAAIICLVLGGLAGYGARYWTERPGGGNAPGGGPGGPGGGMMGGMMGKGGMGGGGGGGQASPTRDLTSLVRRLGTVETVADKDLTADQAQKVLAIAEKLPTIKKITDEDAEKHLDAINAVLNEEQKQALEALQPRGGGGGGGGGMGGMMGKGGMGGMMGGGPPGKGGPPGGGVATSAPMGKGGPPMPMPMGGGMGGMMGGGQQPDNPFTEGQAKERLEELIALLKKKAKV